MEEKYVIKVRCSHCGHEDTLPSEEDESLPMLFDSADAANEYISLLGKKPVKADNVADIGDMQDYECNKCHVVLPLPLLSMNVFVRR